MDQTYMDVLSNITVNRCDIKQPCISVVIPTYNRVDLLGRAIKSVLAQTEQDFEIIVVDDASSTDPSGVIDSFNDSRIRLIRHSKSKGGSAARNTGILNSQGEFIAFLDDDDEWLAEKLELQLVRMRNADLPDMVFTGFYYIDQKTGYTFKVSRPDEQQDLHQRLLRQNIIGTTSTIIVRKTCFSDKLMFDEFMTSCQDWDLYLNFLKFYRIGIIGKPLVNYYVHEKSITRSYTNSLQGHRAILQKVMAYSNCKSVDISYHYYKIGKLAIDFCDNKTGRHELLRSLSHNHFAWLSYLYLLASFVPGDLFQKGAALYNRIKLSTKHPKLRVIKC
jgi:glycosyltransferase involved in cell wall biosynthesis